MLNMAERSEKLHVVIIGAGVLGSASAIELSRRGHRVTILEKAVPGAEASTAAAGMLAPQSECSEDGPLLSLCLDGLAATRRWCDELAAATGIEPELRLRGHLHLAYDDVEHAALAARAAWQTARGLRAELVDAKAARELAPSTTQALGGLYLPDEASLDPRRYGTALGARMRALPIDIKSGALVAGLAIDDGRCVGVRLFETTGESVLRADCVLLCAGAWSSTIEGSTLSLDDVMPVRGQMIEVAGPPQLLPLTVHARGGYFVPRVDGRIVAGSTTERVGFQKAVTAGGIGAILGRLTSTIPALADAQLLATWSGLRPITRDGLPLLGAASVGSSRVDLQACKLEYSIVSPK